MQRCTYIKFGDCLLQYKDVEGYTKMYLGYQKRLTLSVVFLQRYFIILKNSFNGHAAIHFAPKDLVMPEYLTTKGG